MSEGELTGGVNIYEGSHKLGPIKHKISENNGKNFFYANLTNFLAENGFEPLTFGL